MEINDPLQFRAGTNVSASALNELSQGLTRIQRESSNQSFLARALNAFSGTMVTDAFLATIQPESSQYSDARYVLSRSTPHPGAKIVDLITADDDGLPPLNRNLTATNLAEVKVDINGKIVATGSHFVPNGQPVVCIALWHRGNAKGDSSSFGKPIPANKQYVFWWDLGSITVGYDECGDDFQKVGNNTSRLAFNFDDFDLAVPSYGNDTLGNQTVTIEWTGADFSAEPPYGSTVYVDFAKGLTFSTPAESIGNFTNGHYFDAEFVLDSFDASRHGGECDGNVTQALVTGKTFIKCDDKWITNDGSQSGLASGNGTTVGNTTAGVFSHIGPVPDDGQTDPTNVVVGNMSISSPGAGSYGKVLVNPFNIKYDREGHVYRWQSGNQTSLQVANGSTGNVTVANSVTFNSGNCSFTVGNVTLNFDHGLFIGTS